MSDFNINAELEMLLGPDPYVLELPGTIREITKVLLGFRKNTVQLMAVRLRRDPPSHVEEKYFKQLAAFLAAMYNLEMIDPQMKDVAQLDKGLKLIFDPVNKFPIEYAQVAKYIYDKLDSESWGANEVEAEDALEEEISLPSAAKEVASKSANSEKSLLKDSDFPADDDPIYGLRGIMHHILRIKGPNMISYQISPSWTSRNARVFGHNGFKVGTCWPNQMTLLRDGAHGQRMGGISGSVVNGTYSIVISGMYNDLDRDWGESVYYSGSNSHHNTTAEPITSNKTKALERSIATKKPVRVFRTSQGKWAFAPSAGIRYDGLYTVVGMSVETNGNGGGFKSFKLERRNDQDKIMTSEPSTALANCFHRVQAGYTRTRPPKAALNDQ